MDSAECFEKISTIIRIKENMENIKKLKNKIEFVKYSDKFVMFEDGSVYAYQGDERKKITGVVCNGDERLEIGDEENMLKKYLKKYLIELLEVSIKEIEQQNEELKKSLEQE